MELFGMAILFAIAGLWMITTTPRIREVAFGYTALFCVIMFIYSLLTGSGVTHY